ncbi:MAG: holo-ACP synthase [Cytophaga sp.]|uniref:holo-ACP synthase n=1 Tax=Cytophaga sp. TaxID=29535 RepID=UPI003F7EBC72
MNVGIGVDIVDIERMRQRIDAESGFRELVFSREEIAYCEKKANRYESYAARFAAKEALLKAVGTGIDFTLDLKEFSINNEENGKPYFKRSRALNKFLEQHFTGELEVQVSLSHSRQQAIAFVLINQK